MVKKQTERVIKVVRSDNGGEYFRIPSRSFVLCMVFKDTS